MDYDQDLAAYIKAHETYPGSIMPGTTFGGEVGTFNADFVIWNENRTRSRLFSGLVDTEATYPMVPASDLEELGVEREYEIPFNLADGSRVALSVGMVPMELEGRARRVYFAFGPEGAKPLLGALALEVFGFAVDAKNGRLIPVDTPL